MMIRPNIRGIQIEPASPTTEGGMKIRVSHMDSDVLNLIKVEAKGIIPLDNDLIYGGFVISLFDCTGGRLLPIQCESSDFQEEHTSAFQLNYNIGEIGGSLEFLEWTPIGVFSSMLLDGPFEDTKNLMVVARLIDLEYEYYIHHGKVLPTENGVLWTGIKKFKINLWNDGYLESKIRLQRFHFTSIGLAVLMAAACNRIEAHLIEIIQEKIDDWLAEASSSYQIYDGYSSDQERSEKYSTQFNQILQKANGRTLIQSRLLTELKQRCSPSQAVELIELCFDVMMADKIITVATLELIDKIAKATRIDLKKLEKIRDDNIVRISTAINFDIPAEQFLGINSYWKPKKKIKHLESEFHKWNSRLNLVPEGDTRENIQRLLTMIGNTLKEYR